MEKSKIYNKKHKLVREMYKPKCDVDMFMSCISYWIYGNTYKRHNLRVRFVLFFANNCFIQNYDNITDIINAHVANDLDFINDNKYNVNNANDAIKFVCLNSTVGVISSHELMCQVVADCLCAQISMRIGRNKYDSYNHDIKAYIENYICLFYNTTKKEYKLAYIYGLRKVWTKTMYQLRVCKQKDKNNEMRVVCDFKREGRIHSCKINEKINPKWAWTVFPTNGYKQMKKCYIYVMIGNNSNCAKCVTSTDGTLNPYFFIEKDDDEDDNDDDNNNTTIEIFAIEQETLDLSNKLLLYKRKIKAIN